MWCYYEIYGELTNDSYYDCPFCPFCCEMDMIEDNGTNVCKNCGFFLFVMIYKLHTLILMNINSSSKQNHSILENIF